MLEEEYESQRRILPRHLRPKSSGPTRFEYSIRAAVAEDLPGVMQIYNHYVLNTVVTFDEEPTTMAFWQKRLGYLDRLGLPFLVAVSGNDEVLGYALANPWKQKAAYRRTVENSIYLGPAATGRGLGRALMKELLRACQDAGITQVIAVIADTGAEASVALHERFGFVEAGRLGRVGFKFGRWLGTVLYQKTLRRSRRSEPDR